MSYVLDALKKAERERRHQPDLGLDNLEQDDWINPNEASNKPRSRGYLWIAAICLCAMAVILWAGLRDQPSLKPMEDSVLEGSASISEAELNEVIPSEFDNSEESPQQFAESFEPELAPELSLDEVVAQLRFEGSLYVDGDSETSRVFIDGNAYFIGDLILEDVYLLDITSNSAVLSNGYEQVIHSLR